MSGAGKPGNAPAPLAAPVAEAAAAALIGWTVETSLLNAGATSSFTAILFAVSPGDGVVVFRASPAHTLLKADYRFVPVAQIAAIKPLAPPAQAATSPGGGNGSTPALPTSLARALAAPGGAAALEAGGGVGPLADAEVGRRLYDSLARAAARAATRNASVSPAAQALFDALHKTMDCTWDGDQILVLGTVVIRPPYTSDADVGLRSDADPSTHINQTAYARVKTVVSAAATRASVGAFAH